MPLAIISGATGGIGEVIARRLWREGLGLILLGRNPGKLARLAADLLKQVEIGMIAEPRPPLFTLRVDFNDPEEAWRDRLSALMESQPGISTLLVTAHGADPVTDPSASLNISHLRKVIEVDLVGTFRLAQTVYPFMHRQGHGLMVLLSSFHAIGTYPERVPYASAKAGVCGLARALAVEWGRDGIRINALAPGQVDGARSAEFVRRQPGVVDDWKARSPMRCLVNPRDIAETVLWLIRVPSVTGQTLVLDHGVTASLWHGRFEPITSETREVGE